MSNWEWPQYTAATLMFLGLAAEMFLHGKPKIGTFNAGSAMIRIALTSLILYYGGFWK